MTVVAAGSHLSASEIEDFWADGYLTIRGVLPPEEAKHYADLVKDLVPRNLDIPSHWQVSEGRIKPFNTSGNQTFDGPEFIPLWQNESVYSIMTQLLESDRILVRDGSLAVTLRNDAKYDSELSQSLHLDPAVPGYVDDFKHTIEEVEIGGCYYFTDVETGGGGIRVVPGGHRVVERESSQVEKGRQLYKRWTDFAHLFPETVEVTGQAGDFVLMHHLMPHAASHNRRDRTRVAQFFRYARVDQPYAVGERPGDQAADHSYNHLQISSMTPLGRKLLAVDNW